MSTDDVTALKVSVGKMEERLEMLNKSMDSWKSRDYWVRIITTLLAGAGLALGAGSVVRDGIRDVGAAVSEMK